MVRTQIAVVGVTEEEVEEGLSNLLGDLLHCPELKWATAHWDEDQDALVVVVDAEGDDPGLENGAGATSYDVVRETVSANPVFTGDQIEFHIVDCQVLPV